jgi:hypothetical protein
MDNLSAENKQSPMVLCKASVSLPSHLSFVHKDNMIYSHLTHIRQGQVSSMLPSTFHNPLHQRTQNLSFFVGGRHIGRPTDGQMHEKLRHPTGFGAAAVALSSTRTNKGLSGINSYYCLLSLTHTLLILLCKTQAMS